MRKEWRNRGRPAQSGPRSRDDYLPRDLPSPLRSLMDSPFVARPGFPAPAQFPRFAQLSSLATPYTYAACDVPNLCINHGTARLFRHLRDRRPPHPTGLSGCHPLRHPILPTRGSLPRSRLHRSPGQRLCRRRLQRPADSPRRDRPFPPRAVRYRRHPPLRHRDYRRAGSDAGVPAQSRRRPWVRPPDLDEFYRWQDAARGRIRIVTLSPEWPQAPRYIERITAEGVVASIGHTKAGAAQIADAVAAGATLSTHLGNGAHQLLRRHPNYIWEQLAEDRLMAGFIVDGIHLGAAFLKSAIRAKTVERSLLVTDAATPAGAVPGRYYLGGQPVDLTDEGRGVLAGTDRLAGSALHMHRGVENLMRLAGLSLADEAHQ